MSEILKAKRSCSWTSRCSKIRPWKYNNRYSSVICTCLTSTDTTSIQFSVESVLISYCLIKMHNLNHPTPKTLQIRQKIIAIKILSAIIQMRSWALTIRMNLDRTKQSLKDIFKIWQMILLINN